MKIIKIIYILITLFGSFMAYSQTERVYVDKRDTIVLFGDSVIKFHFHYGDVDCYATYKDYKKKISIDFCYYEVYIDTLEKDCEGFYYEGEEIAILEGTKKIEPNNEMFIPFTFNQDSISFIFAQEYMNGMENFKLKKMTPGCYKVIIEFNGCSFFYSSNQYKIIKLKRRGKKLIMGDYKYYLVEPQ